MNRCKTGAKLLHRWAQAVQTASQMEWQRVMFGPRQYDKHRAKCAKCQQADIKAKDK